MVLEITIIIIVILTIANFIVLYKNRILKNKLLIFKTNQKTVSNNWRKPSLPQANPLIYKGNSSTSGGSNLNYGSLKENCKALEPLKLNEGQGLKNIETASKLQTAILASLAPPSTAASNYKRLVVLGRHGLKR